jgi:glycoside hydrolase-like protein
MRLNQILRVAIFAALACCAARQSMAQTGNAPHNYAGFDANEYPGHDQLAALHQQFAFTGYWLNNPPGATSNPWAGKRGPLERAGFGFLVVFNGRLDNQILAAQKAGKSPSALARQDAAAAVAAAQREGFPPGTIIFLDQEEGGRMLPEQAAYLLGWTEALTATGYKPGVYGSGKPVPDEDENGRKITITTIQDIRAQVAAKHLHPIAFWVYQDACPPAPGCVVDPAKLPAPEISGTLDAAAWQFAQSPQEKDITKACAATYSHDGSCYLPGAPPALAHYRLDLNVSTSPDPSHGR